MNFELAPIHVFDKILVILMSNKVSNSLPFLVVTKCDRIITNWDSLVYFFKMRWIVVTNLI